MSVGAVDRDCKGRADVPHPGFGQPANAVNENCDRDALDRVQVDRRTLRDWIGTGFEDDLAGKPANSCRARRNKRASKTRDRCIPRQHDDGAPTDLSYFAPPDFPAGRGCDHEAATARRNDARSPHSSGSSEG